MQEKIRKAAEQWVSEFNAIHLSMIEELYHNCPWNWKEITKPTYGDYVNVHGKCTEANTKSDYVCHDETGTILEILDNTEFYRISLDSNTEIIANISQIEIDNESIFPMWGTMWSFGNSIDDYWLSNNLQTVSNLGFRIYEHQEWGYFFGIDGAGYNFYEEHWIPLYKARGLEWHL